MKTSRAIGLALLVGYLLATYVVPPILGPYKTWLLCREDAYFEVVSAACYLLACVVLFAVYLSGRERDASGALIARRNHILLLLALLMLVAVGEELSWGQRILHFATPKAMVSANVQREVNVHNLALMSGSRFANLQFYWGAAWFFYFACLPWLQRAIPRLDQWLRRVRVPVVPLWLALTYLLNTVLFEGTQIIRAWESKHHLQEVQEADQALLFAVMAFVFLWERRPRAVARGGTLD